jgi:rubredoxin
MARPNASAQWEIDLAHAGFAPCRRCGQVRDIEAFARSRNRRSNGRQYMCRQCAYIHARELGIKKRGVEGDKAERSRLSSAWQARQGKLHPEKFRAARRRYHLKTRYDMDQAEFDKLLADQDNRCGLCETPNPGPKGWHVDHDHGSGEVRGILCNPCNVALGLFRDNPYTIQMALIYLRPRKVSPESGSPLSSPDSGALLLERSL